MGFLNPNYPLSGESGGAVKLGRDVIATTLVQIKLVRRSELVRVGVLPVLKRKGEKRENKSGGCGSLTPLNLNKFLVSGV